jgi:DNA-binding NarL/FixJ family response regulator
MVHIACFHEHTFISDAIKRLLHDEPDFKIVFETDYFRDLGYQLTRHPIHILVITRNEKLEQLCDIILSIAKEHEELPVVYIQTDHDLVKAKELEQCGVTVLMQGMATLDVLDCIRKKASRFAGDTASTHRKKQFQLSSGDHSNAFSLLDKREQDIVYLLSQNLSRKEIADRLCIAVNTINTYLQRAKKKCDCKTPEELIEMCSDNIRMRKTGSE